MEKSFFRFGHGITMRKSTSGPGKKSSGE